MGELVTLGGTGAVAAETPHRPPSVNTTRSIRSASSASCARRREKKVPGLVRRAAEGDQCSWDELIEEFAALLSGIARSYRLSDADAAEVSQITWLRFAEHIDRLRDPTQVGVWLATTARRECIHQLQRTSRVIPNGSIPNGLSKEVSDAPAPDAALLTKERDVALRSALEHLPDRERRLLRMLMDDPTSTSAEISAALRMPIGSIGFMRARALQRLCEWIGRSFTDGRDSPCGTALPEPRHDAMCVRTPNRAPSDREIATSFGNAGPLDRLDPAMHWLPRARDSAAVLHRRRVGVVYEWADLILRLAFEGDAEAEPSDSSVDDWYRRMPSPIMIGRPQNVTSCQIALQRHEWPVAFRASLSLRHRNAVCRGPAGVRFAQLRQQTRTLVPIVASRRGPRETRAGPSRRSQDQQTEDADSELVGREVKRA